MTKKIVLAYSGGLDTSIIISWLKENYDCEVIALTVDVGQGEELAPLEEKALKSGASKFYVKDVRQEFVTDFIFPALKADALYQGKYLLGTAMARPLIAKCLVEIAHQEEATAIAHGATGKGNDQVRFELGVKALDPDLEVIAPWRIWDIKSREDAIVYAQKRNIPVPVTKEKIYSRDRNLWHLSHEGGELEDPSKEAPSDLYTIITHPFKAPDSVKEVEITFEKGIPVKVDGQNLPPVELVSYLNEIAAQNGVGIVDMVEDRLVGLKSRGVYETPGGTVLYYAHRELERITLDRQTAAFKEIVAQRYAELVYDGLWYSALKEALDAFVDKTQERVTGKVRLKLYKGNMFNAGITSPYSLYRQDLATFGEDEIYDQKDAAGFIRLFGLPLTVAAKLQKGSEPR